jgi:hypothetical protein
MICYSPDGQCFKADALFTPSPITVRLCLSWKGRGSESLLETALSLVQAILDPPCRIRQLGV